MASKRPQSDPQLSADLLGYHLGIADAETRQRVESRLSDPAARAAALARVAAALAPLNAALAPPPPNLVAGIMKRVAATRKTIPLHPKNAPEPGEVAAARTTERGLGGRPIMALRELASLAAAILLFIGIFVPGYQTARQAAQRNACAAHLRQLGQGYAGYAETHGSLWPFAGSPPADRPWVVVGNDSQDRASNSRHAFILVRGRLVSPESFTCPARPNDRAMSLGQADTLGDFPDASNNSYSTNFVTRPWRQGEFMPDTPIAADMTPLLDGRHRLLPLDRASLNSDSHGRSAGQNVLRADLSVRFFRNPYVGVEGDDIYRLIGVQRYTGLERPTLKSDAFLIP